MADLAKIRALAQAILDEAADPVPPPAPDPDPPPPPPDPIPDPVPDPVPPPPPPAPPIGGLTVAKTLADLTARLKALGPGAHKIGLAKGVHGQLTVAGVKTGGLVEVIAEEEGAVLLDRVRVSNSADVALRGLKVIPQADVAVGVTDYGFRADDTTMRVMFDNCTAWGRDDAPHHAYWLKSDWLAREVGGFQLEGPDSEVDACTVLAGRLGFFLGPQAVGSRVLNSKGEGLSHDGIRLNGNGQRAAYNRISDQVYLGDGNHPDMIQAFGKPLGTNTYTPLLDLLIEDNVLLEWTIRQDNPLALLNTWATKGIRGPQGIFLGNPPFIRPIVRGNKIATGHWHGLTINGGQEMQVETNTIWNPNHMLPGANPQAPRMSLTGTITSQKGNIASTFLNKATGTKTDYSNLPVV